MKEKKQISPVSKVNRLCKAIAALTDDDIIEVEKIAREQVAYSHPLKMATARKINSTGKHNLSVLEDLRKIRETILKFKQ